MQYLKQGEFNIFGYDYKGFYQSLLVGKDFYIPHCSGTFKTLKKIPEKPMLGFYFVNISCDDENFKKIFMFSKDNVIYNLHRFQLICLIAILKKILIYYPNLFFRIYKSILSSFLITGKSYILNQKHFIFFIKILLIKINMENKIKMNNGSKAGQEVFHFHLHIVSNG